ncbi:MAG: tyrosine-type recombinase/integrase [Halioglobus sp.]
MARVKLTQKYIDNPPPVPSTKAKVEHCDISLPGFLWEQRATNQEWGSFRLRYKPDGKTAYITVGRSCDITLAEARKKAKQLKAEIQLGADPQAAVRERRRGLTWNEFWDLHYWPYISNRKRSKGNDEEMHRLRIQKRFGHLKLNQFSRKAVQQFHNDLRNEGLAPATCDHYLKLLRQALNVAVDLELLDRSPIAKVKLFNEDNQKERLMSPKELQRLMTALNNDENRGRTARLVCKFLILTGARVNEALHAKWSDIDQGNRVWQIQATNSKSKRRRSVPLNDGALAVLGKLKSKGKSDWVFTSSRGDGLQRLTTINKNWQKTRREAGLESVRIHDLRHQYASMLVNSGRTLYEVQAILGHSTPLISQRYSHLSSETLQDAANAASDQVNAATNPSN